MTEQELIDIESRVNCIVGYMRENMEADISALIAEVRRLTRHPRRLKPNVTLDAIYFNGELKYKATDKPRRQ